MGRSGPLSPGLRARRGSRLSVKGLSLSPGEDWGAPEKWPEGLEVALVGPVHRMTGSEDPKGTVPLTGAQDLTQMCGGSFVQRREPP